MKKNLASITLFCLFSICLNAQVPSDSGIKTNDNYYGPFHRTIRDTASQTVSKFGFYTSLGVGLSRVANMRGVSRIFNQSFSYKSWLLTFSGGLATGRTSDLSGPSYFTYYHALLIGQSVRTKHTLISLSAGLGSTWIELDNYSNNYNPPLPAWPFGYSDKGIISIPMELRIFGLAYNLAGIGFHLSYDLMPKFRAFSPYYFGIVLVAGKWNKPRKHLFKHSKKESITKTSYPETNFQPQFADIPEILTFAVPKK